MRYKITPLKGDLQNIPLTLEIDETHEIILSWEKKDNAAVVAYFEKQRQTLDLGGGSTWWNTIYNKEENKLDSHPAQDINDSLFLIFFIQQMHLIAQLGDVGVCVVYGVDDVLTETIEPNKNINPSEVFDKLEAANIFWDEQIESVAQQRAQVIKASQEINNDTSTSTSQSFDENDGTDNPEQKTFTFRQKLAQAWSELPLGVKILLGITIGVGGGAVVGSIIMGTIIATGGLALLPTAITGAIAAAGLAAYAVPLIIAAGAVAGWLVGGALALLGLAGKKLFDGPPTTPPSAVKNRRPTTSSLGEKEKKNVEESLAKKVKGSGSGHSVVTPLTVSTNSGNNVVASSTSKITPGSGVGSSGSSS